MIDATRRTRLEGQTFFKSSLPHRRAQHGSRYVPAQVARKGFTELRAIMPSSLPLRQNSGQTLAC